MPLSKLQWWILFSVWVLGMIAFPVTSGFGVPIPAIAYVGYSSLCSFILANHPWVVNLVKRVEDKKDDDAERDKQ